MSSETIELFNPFKQYYIVAIPEPIATYRGLSPGAKLVYGRLQRYAGRKGIAFPSIPELADEVGLGERQTKTYLAELVEQKFIHRQRVFARGNVYSFIKHPCLTGSEIGSSRANSGAFTKGWNAARQTDGRDAAPDAGRDDAPYIGRDTAPLIGKSQEERVNEENQYCEQPLSQEENLQNLSTPEDLLEPEHPPVPAAPPQAPTCVHHESVGEIDVEDERIGEFVRLAYSRERRVRFKPDTRAQADVLAELERLDSPEFRAAFLNYLEDNSDWLKQNKWPIRTFLRQWPKYDRPTPPRTDSHNAEPRQSTAREFVDANRQADVQNRTSGLETAIPGELPARAVQWNALVSEDLRITTWGRYAPRAKLDEAEALPEFRDNFEEICRRSVQYHEHHAVAGVTFEWLFKQIKGYPPNWERVRQKDWDWVIQKRQEEQHRNGNQRPNDDAGRRLATALDLLA